MPKFTRSFSFEWFIAIPYDFQNTGFLFVLHWGGFSFGNILDVFFIHFNYQDLINR